MITTTQTTAFFYNGLSNKNSFLSEYRENDCPENESAFLVTLIDDDSNNTNNNNRGSNESKHGFDPKKIKVNFHKQRNRLS